MIVRAHDHLKGLQEVKASRAAVLDDLGNPIAIIVRVGSAHQVLVASDPGFKASLSMFGLSFPEVSKGPKLSPI